MEDIRIKFYSVDDMSSVGNLQRAETFFQHWDEETCKPTINTILELYNIKKFFDVGMWIKQWTEVQIAECRDRCKLIPEIIGGFCANISDANIGSLYEAAEPKYFGDFWELISHYKVYQRISPEAMSVLMGRNKYTVWEILKQRTLVQHFGQVIADHLLHNPHTAGHLISHFLLAS